MAKFKVILRANITVDVDHDTITDSVEAMRFAEANAAVDGFVPTWEAVDVEEVQ